MPKKDSIIYSKVSTKAKGSQTDLKLAGGGNKGFGLAGWRWRQEGLGLWFWELAGFLQ